MLIILETVILSGCKSLIGQLNILRQVCFAYIKVLNKSSSARDEYIY